MCAIFVNKPRSVRKLPAYREPSVKHDNSAKEHFTFFKTVRSKLNLQNLLQSTDSSPRDTDSLHSELYVTHYVSGQTVSVEPRTPSWQRGHGRNNRHTYQSLGTSAPVTAGWATCQQISTRSRKLSGKGKHFAEN